MKFNIRQKGRKSNRKESLTNLRKSPAIMASGLSTKILPENPNEICDKLKFIVQEKKTGKNSDIINEENVAIVD